MQLKNPTKTARELIGKASKATRGPWKIDKEYADSALDAVTMKPGYWFAPGHYPRCYELEDPDYTKKDASYIAACSPDVITTLMERLIGLEEAMEKIADESWYVSGFVPCEDEQSRRAILMDRINEVRGLSREALKGTND